MKLILNGVDFSGRFNRYGVSAGFERVEGPNSGTAMDGTAIIDLVATKDTLDLEGNYFTQEDYAQLVVICKNAVILVTLDDPNTGEEDVTKTMIPTLSAAHQVPMRGQLFYDGIRLTLKEQ